MKPSKETLDELVNAVRDELAKDVYISHVGLALSVCNAVIASKEVAELVEALEYAAAGNDALVVEIARKTLIKFHQGE